MTTSTESSYYTWSGRQLGWLESLLNRLIVVEGAAQRLSSSLSGFTAKDDDQTTISYSLQEELHWRNRIAADLAYRLSVIRRQRL